MLTGILIIVCGTLVSGLIAYLGNQFGRYIGRKKMSIFKLRPRHTSILITVVSGMVIFLITTSIAMIISKDVRTFITGMEELRKEREKLTGQVASLRERLNQPFVFSIGEPLAIGKIQCGGSAAKIRGQLDELLARTNAFAVAKCNQWAQNNGITQLIPPTERLAGYIPEEYQKLQEELAKKKGDTAIIVLTTWNVPFGEKVGVTFRTFEHRRVFSKDEVLLQQKFNGRENPDRLLIELINFLQGKLQVKAEQSGILRDPQTNTMFEMSYDHLFKARREIMSGGRSVNVKVIANRDIYNINPLDVRLEVER